MSSISLIDLFLQSRTFFCYRIKNEIKGDILGWTTSRMYQFENMKMQMVTKMSPINELI